MSPALETAWRMTPQERQEIHALALGFGVMRMAQHRPETEVFAARWPGLLRLRWGYPLKDGGWSRSRRFFSVSLTRAGLQAAFFIYAHRLPRSEKARARKRPPA